MATTPVPLETLHLDFLSKKGINFLIAREASKHGWWYALILGQLLYGHGETEDWDANTHDMLSIDAIKHYHTSGALGLASHGCALDTIAFSRNK